MSTYSEEHKAFLKKIKREKLTIGISRASIIIFFLVIWEILARFNLINTFLSSSPSKVLATTISLFKTGSLFNHIGITL